MPVETREHTGQQGGMTHRKPSPDQDNQGGRVGQKQTDHPSGAGLRPRTLCDGREDIGTSQSSRHIAHANTHLLGSIQGTTLTHSHHRHTALCRRAPCPCSYRSSTGLTRTARSPAGREPCMHVYQLMHCRAVPDSPRVGLAVQKGVQAPDQGYSTIVIMPVPRSPWEIWRWPRIHTRPRPPRMYP